MAYEANMTMHNADVMEFSLLAYDLTTARRIISLNIVRATVLHIDIDPTSLSKTVNADIPVVGDTHGTGTNAGATGAGYASQPLG